MKVIIAWDGDHIGREVGRASLADDVEGLRRISQAIDNGNRIWQSWVTMNGGSIISFGGDEGRAEILAEKLSELPRIRDQYASAVGSTVSVGVGTKLSEADRALMAGKLQGGDKIVLYTPEVEQLIEKLEKQHGEKNEADKLSEEYLQKAAPAAAEGAHAGFSGASKPQGPTVQKPKGEASEHSQGEAAAAAADDAPSKPEATNSANQFEGMFHDAAQAQDAKDQGQTTTAGQDQIKVQVVEVLKQLKGQMPILEQVKQSAPDTYQAVMGLAQAVIMMARQMNGDDPNQQGPRETEDRAASQAQIEVPLPPEEQEKGDSDGKSDDTKKALTKAVIEDFDRAAVVGKHGEISRGDGAFTLKTDGKLIASGDSQSLLVLAKQWKFSGVKFVDLYRDDGTLVVDDAPPKIDGGESFSVSFQKGERAYKLEGDALIEVDPKTGKSLGKGPVNKDNMDPGDDPEIKTRIGEKRVTELGATIKGEKDPGKKESWHNCDEHGHCWGEGETADHCLICGQGPEALDKASLQAGPTVPAQRHYLNLPVGSKKDPSSSGTREAGKIKVTHKETGKDGWISARAGQVLSADGHPISALNPGGK